MGTLKDKYCFNCKKITKTIISIGNRKECCDECRKPRIAAEQNASMTSRTMWATITWLILACFGLWFICTLIYDLIKGLL